MIIGCTEFKFQHVSNLDLNSLMFSNYKNIMTWKALIGIAPHGKGLFFSDIYPGSLSDNCITEKSGVVQRTYAISAVVLHMLRLVFSLQFRDSVSRRQAMVIHGNRFHLVLLDNHNEPWLVFHFQT